MTLAFVYRTPEHDPDTNLPATDFGMHCSGATYQVQGHSSGLLSECSEIIEDIPICQQTYGTKILLSVGGEYSARNDYSLSSEQAGEDFANFLWQAFGPYDPHAGYHGPRPIDPPAPADDGHHGYDATAIHNAVDGFDLDLESKFPDQKPWIRFVERLHWHFDM